MGVYVYFWVTGWFCGVHLGMMWAFKKSPRLATVLLISCKPPERKQKEPLDARNRTRELEPGEEYEMEPMMELDISEVNLHESGDNLEVGPLIEPKEKETNHKDDELELGAYALCFFVNNLMLCVLWYAFKYDSVGTTNPSWTQVFG